MDLFVFRTLVDGKPLFKCDPQLGDGGITADYRLAETRPSDCGWPTGPEWAGFEPVGLMLKSKQGGDRQYNKRRRKAGRKLLHDS